MMDSLGSDSMPVWSVAAVATAPGGNRTAAGEAPRGPAPTAGRGRARKPTPEPPAASSGLRAEVKEVGETDDH